MPTTQTPAITKEMFMAYETVRRSGLTNMFMVPMVCNLSGLTRPEVLSIVKQYSQLKERYPDVRK